MSLHFKEFNLFMAPDLLFGKVTSDDFNGNRTF